MRSEVRQGGLIRYIEWVAYIQFSENILQLSQDKVVVYICI